MPKSIFILLLLLSSIYAGSITVDHSYFRKAPDYDNGTVHMFIKNDSDKDITVSKIILNDVPMDNMPNELAIWYQVVPDSIKAGKISDVMVKLIRPTNKLVKIEIEASNGDKSECVVQPIQPPLKLTYIGFGEKYDEVYFYVQNLGKEPYTMNKIFLNSKDETKSTKIVGLTRINSQEKVCGIIKLKTPLSSGEYISLKVTTKEDEDILTEAVVRVYNYFPVQAFGDELRDELGFDKDRFCIYKYPEKEEDWEKAETSKSHRAYHLIDDPACGDAKSGILGFNAKEIIERGKECRKKDSVHPTLVYLCAYEKPKNYFVYGELTDITFVNPYQVVFSEEKPERDGYFTGLAKLACEPKILMTIPEAFTEKGKRYPTPEEERILVYSEIVNGSKGLWYWTRTKEKGGYESNAALEKEIGVINREINTIKKYLIIGETFDLVTTSDAKVEANAILCGDKGIILILINKDYESSFESDKIPFVSVSKYNITVSIKVPNGFNKISSVSEVTNGMLAELKYIQKDDIVVLCIDKLDITKQYILK